MQGTISHTARHFDRMESPWMPGNTDTPKGRRRISALTFSPTWALRCGNRIRARAVLISLCVLCPGLSFSLIKAAAAELAIHAWGATFTFSKTFFENLREARSHTILVEAIRAAGIEPLLDDEGSYTLFAPTNEAFTQLPKDTRAVWLQPENHDTLAALLRYQIVAGRHSVETMLAALRREKGPIRLKTLQGEEIIVTEDGRRLILTDARGGRAMMTYVDIPEKNGLLHIIDKVLQPARLDWIVLTPPPSLAPPSIDEPASSSAGEH